MNFMRRERIAELLKEKGSISLKELSEIFSDVSEMTLRRDLMWAEEQGIAVRIRGGAKYQPGIQHREPSYDVRAIENRLAKEKIARLAIPYIKYGGSIFLDSGTTSMALAKLLPDMNLSLLTSGPNIALEAAKKNIPDITLAGGSLNRSNLSLSGHVAVASVGGINIDTAFITPSGYTAESGFTCGNYDEGEVKRTVISKARTVILLIDNSKMGRMLPFTFAVIGDADIIITDKHPPKELMESAGKSGVTVICE